LPAADLNPGNSPKRRKIMKCPNCGERKKIVIDLHSEGFTSDENPIKECGACGLVWRVKTVKGKAEVDIVKPAKAKK
jgi:uncharacterized Zn finger protein